MSEPTNYSRQLSSKTSKHGGVAATRPVATPAVMRPLVRCFVSDSCHSPHSPLVNLSERPRREGGRKWRSGQRIASGLRLSIKRIVACFCCIHTHTHTHRQELLRSRVAGLMRARRAGYLFRISQLVNIWHFETTTGLMYSRDPLSAAGDARWGEACRVTQLMAIHLRLLFGAIDDVSVTTLSSR
jgi:hypothetical protein